MSDQRPIPQQQNPNSGAVVNGGSAGPRAKVYNTHSYVTRGGASDAGRGLRSQDPAERKKAAQYMAQYRNKKKQTQK